MANPDEVSGIEPSQACPNCGSSAVDRYCAQCGQRSGSLHVPLRTITNEALTRFFAFDSRAWQTLRILMRRPGQLTLEYLAGRRARYLAPLQLYLFVSFFSFLLLAVGRSGPTATMDPGGADTLVVAEDVDLQKPGKHAWFNRYIQRAVDDPGGTLSYFRRRLPWVFFFIMPVFASVLQLLYRRREAYYVPHLIFTLHVYTAGFLWNSLGVVANLALNIAVASGLAAVLAILGYVYFALRRVYQEGVLRTLLKQALLMFVHGMVALIGVVLLLVYVVLTL